MWIAGVLLACMLGQVPTTSAGDPWQPVFTDDFERGELGADWYLRGGKARIESGRLILEGAGATLLVDRPFAPDVRIEFTAEALPGLPPCDLSVAMGASRLLGYHYLLAFGGESNRANRILGPRDGGVRDRKPAMLIEPGRRYRITALKEGRRLALEVDGKTLLETQDADPVGGPGFDRVGLVTWNGMIVDDVRVSERVSPAPDGPRVLSRLQPMGWRWQNRKLEPTGQASPELAPALVAYNAGRIDEAVRLLFEQGSLEPEGVALLAWCLGDLAHEEKPAELAGLATRARDTAAGYRDHPAMADLALAAEWFSRLNLRSRDRVAAVRLMSLDPQSNPFNHKARLWLARYHYAAALEGADRTRVAEAMEMFNALKAIWPEHPGLRELTGERVPWGKELIRPDSDGPEWARCLQEAAARHQAILNWWFAKRQAPDGQLGGGWGDDVEILRGWAPAACWSSACEPAIAGIERLAEGVWTHVLQDGYDADPGDVEHSAEPSADSLPPMLLLRHGDAKWLERNRLSARTIRERFMAVNQRGHLQFISSEFGATQTRTGPQAGGDTGYSGRPMRHLLWLAWMGDVQAKKTYLDWCDAWLDATMRAEGSKPAGFVPASLFFPSGSTAPPDGRAWHDTAAHYYGFPGLPRMTHEQFLSAYWLSGDKKYLEPVRIVLEVNQGPIHELDPARPADDPYNLAVRQMHQADGKIIATYRWLTGDRTYDQLLLRRGPTAYQRFLVDGDEARYLGSLRQLAERLRSNWATRTSEVLQTDRAGLDGSVDVLSAYTGAVRDFTDSATPTIAATWDSPNLDFAAVVLAADTRTLRIRLYSFADKPVSLGLHAWRLAPGRYTLTAGPPGKAPAVTRTITHTRPGSPIPLDLPARTEWSIQLNAE